MVMSDPDSVFINRTRINAHCQTNPLFALQLHILLLPQAHQC